MNLEDVILRGTRADQPLATDVPSGTLYYVTDELTTEQSRGSAWVTYSDGGDGLTNIDPAGAISGDGTSGSPLAVKVDGATIDINGSDELEVIGTFGIDQLTGDVTAGPGSGSQAASIAANAVVTAKINNKAVTYAKIQDISATKVVLGRKTAAAGVTEECTTSDILDFIASAAQGDILYRGSAGWSYLAPGTDGKVLTTHGASADPTWETPSAGAGAMTLLHTGSGTSVATGATTVDSYALASQLGANDTLMVVVTCESNGNTTSSIGLTNSTDSVTFTNSSMTSNNDMSFTAFLRAAQSTTKRIDYYQFGQVGTAAPSALNTGTLRKAFTTDWTGAWTLALSYSSLTSGATFTYRWSIYKIAG